MRRAALRIVGVALALGASAIEGSAVESAFTERKIINSYSGPVSCKTGATEYVLGADGRQPVEFFYYAHDPRRLWVRAGFTYVLGSDTVCQINGLETAHP